MRCRPRRIHSSLTLVFALCVLGSMALSDTRAAVIDDLPSREIALNAAFPADKLDPALRPLVFGRPNGEVCALAQVGWKTVSLYSADGGATFAPWVDVLGGAGVTRSTDFAAHLSADGQLYVVVSVEDPEGGRGTLLVVRSDDMGRTWSAPVRVLSFLDPGAGSYQIRNTTAIASGRGGRVAITAARDESVLVSSVDHGVSWTAPLVVSDRSRFADVAVAPTSGAIHVVTTAYLYDSCAGGSFNRPVVRTSTDGGLSLDPTVPLTDLCRGNDVYAFAVRTANDDSVLVAVTVSDSTDSGPRVFRSIDVGTTFETVLSESLGPDGGFVFDNESLTVAVAPGSPTILLAFADAATGGLRVARSGDHGATFAPSQPFLGSYPYSSQYIPTVLTRTEDGTWVIVWDDYRGSLGAGASGVYLRSSIDDGLSWNDEVTVYPAGGYYAPSDAAATGPDNVVVTSGDEVSGILIARGSASTPAFGSSTHWEIDTGVRNRPHAGWPAIAALNDGRVFVTFSSEDSVYVTVSTDRGRSFDDPVRVSSWAPGTWTSIYRQPLVAASSDGYVYVAYIATHDPDGLSWNLHVTASSDGGTTWPAAETIVQSNVGWVEFEIAAASGGKAFLTLRQDGVLMHQTTDGGENWTSHQLSDNLGSRAARICTGGDTVAAIWEGGLAGEYGQYPWVAISEDGGVTWGTPESLNDLSYLLDWSGAMGVDCHPDGAVAVAWGGAGAVWSSLYVPGSGWSADMQALSSVGLSVVSTVWAGPTRDDGVVVFNNSLGPPMIAARASGPGAPFGAPIELSTPMPENRYMIPIGAASDRQGNVWLWWEDDGVASSLKASVASSIVVARSTDGGISFDPPRRMHHDQPPGFFANVGAFRAYRVGLREPVAATANSGLVAWSSDRTGSGLGTPLFNGDDLLDPDRDGAEGGTDCDPTNPDVYPGAPEICDGLDNDCDTVVPAEEVDVDSDGFRICNGDCVEGNGDVFPGAPEACDDVDNQCPGDPGFGVTDETCPIGLVESEGNWLDEFSCEYYLGGSPDIFEQDGRPASSIEFHTADAYTYSFAPYTLPGLGSNEFFHGTLDIKLLEPTSRPALADFGLAVDPSCDWNPQAGPASGRYPIPRIHYYGDEQRIYVQYVDETMTLVTETVDHVLSTDVWYNPELFLFENPGGGYTFRFMIDGRILYEGVSHETIGFNESLAVQIGAGSSGAVTHVRYDNIYTQVIPGLPEVWHIDTAAGSWVPQNGIAGTDVQIDWPIMAATDALDNVYVTVANSVFKFNSAGVFSLLAGTGTPGYGGDWGPATSAEMHNPFGIAVDNAGNVYVSDLGNRRVRKIDPTGTITTVAGNGELGNDGDGGPATEARIGAPYGLAVDDAGNLYIVDTGFDVVRKVDATGIISTVVGIGFCGFSGDGGPASAAGLCNPWDAATDDAGNLYIADYGNRRIRKVDPGGTITTIAGTGAWNHSGEGGPAVDAELAGPVSVDVDDSGNIYIVEVAGWVSKIDSGGIFTTIGGTGSWGWGGDGGPATAAQLDFPFGLALDSANNVYVVDNENDRIRKIDGAGIITTFAGSGGFDGEGGPAFDSRTFLPRGVATDDAGNLYIADYGNHALRKVDTVGTITTIVGTELRGYIGDGGPAVNAQLSYPQDVALDAEGNIYIADSGNRVVRKIDTGGQISTVAGGGADSPGDGGPATDALLDRPAAVAVDTAGNLYIADGNGHRVHRVDPGGIITTVAGTGIEGFSGDGGPGTLAELNNPEALEVDAAGNLYIADSLNHRVRVVDGGGTITTFAGNGLADWAGDGGQAVDAQLSRPFGLAFDQDGNLYISEVWNQLVRKVAPDGTISTVAGSNDFGFRGDGGVAYSHHARLASPWGIAVDNSGKIYVADHNNNRIRVISQEDADSDGYPVGIDCDDNDPTVFPGHPELCDNKDNDCDGTVDDFATTCGIGECASAGHCLAGVDDCVAGAPVAELCDGLDNNCDGEIDDGNPGGGAACNTGLPGVCATGIEICEEGALVCTPTDAAPLCDGFDTDCDGSVDVCDDLVFLPGFGEDGFDEGEVNYPIGVALDSAGNVYVADSDHVQKFDRDGIFLSLIGSVGFGPGQYTVPYGVAVAADDTLYVSDPGNERILRFDPTGAFLDEWGSPGTAPGEFQTAYGIAFDSQGDVYVCDFAGNRMQKFDALGNFLLEWGSFGFGPGEFFGPAGVAVDSQDRVYVVETYNERVQVFDTTGVFLDTWGMPGGGAGEFLSPWGIAVDELDFVYVSDYGNRVQKFTALGDYVSEFGTGGGGPGEIYLPEGLVVGTDGEIYLADGGNHRVQRFDAGGGYISDWGFPIIETGEMWSPVDVVVDDQGDIYVADFDADRVTKYDANGQVLLQWGIEGSGPGEFNTPRGLVIDPAGDIYVVDMSNHRVQKFDAAGNYLMQWGERGGDPGQFRTPRDIAVAPDGTLLVVDLGNRRVQRFDAAGTFIAAWGTQGDNPGEFQGPRGVDVADDGRVFVTDVLRDRVLVFSAAGEFLIEWGNSGAGPGELDGPQHLVIDQDGNIYVTEYHNQRVQKFDETGTSLGMWGSPGSGPGELINPVGIDIAPDGSIYVADTGNSRLQILGCAQPTSWFRDYDGDSWGSGLSTLPECDQPAGFASRSGDCNDADPSVNPEATEICDGVDNDCDAGIDEEFPGQGNSCITGLFGECSAGTTVCAVGGPVCDQNVFPAAEICDGLDNDCDGIIDEGASDVEDSDVDGVNDLCDNCPFNFNPVQADSDSDGFGDICDPFLVTNISPADNAIDVPPAIQTTATFELEVDPATVTTATFLLTEVGVGPVAGSVYVAPNALSATFVPTTTLNENTLYQVELTSGITNPSGERPLESFTSFFNTETAPPPNEPLPEASEEVPGPAPAAAAGSALAGTGDLNGDGINDFIAGAPGSNVPDPGGAHQPDLVAAGAALLYFGSSDDAELASPDIIFEGEAAHDRAGTALAANFDFNGDGVGDLLIGAEQVDRSTDTPVGAGKVYLIYFDPTDTTHYPNINDPNTPDTVSLSLVGQAGGIPGVVFTGQALGDTAGFALDGGGLFNVGTGPDLLIGAPGRDVNALVDAGTVYIIYDDPTLSGAIDLGQVANTVHGMVVRGSGAGDLLGYSVAWLGPVFTPPQPGARDTFLGNDSAGMGAPGDDDEDEGLDDTGTVAALEGGVADDSVVEFNQVGDEEPGFLVRGSQAGEMLGWSLDSGGDNISDGIEDILIGAPGYDRPDGSGDDAGQVVQVSDTLPTSGSASSSDVGFGKANGLRGIRWIGEAGDMLGTAVSGLGDVSGDGLDDVAFTAPTADPSGIVDAGVVVVVYGAPAQSYTQDTQDAVDVGTVIPGEILAGTVEGEQTGTAVSDAGDVTGDGEPDVLVGAAEADTAAGIDSGEIFVVTDTTPGDVGECDADGCLGQDLDTGAQIIVPAGVLQEGESVTAEGVLDPVDLPVTEPIEQSLLGAAEFAVVSGGVEKGVGPEMEATIPVRPELEGQLVDGEEFYLYEFNGVGWTNTGYIGTVGPNPSYPERKAINGLVPGFGYYTTFIADQDGDGIRDSLDPDRDGDGVDNDDDNCPLDANTSQGDCDFDGVGDVCDPDACEGLRLALSSLTVETTRAGAMVRWETASEVDVESFQVVRQRETDPPRVISPPIPAVGTPYRGAEYEFRDTGHEIVGVLNYFVAAIGTDGSVDMFGPVIIVPVHRPPGSPREEPKEPPTEDPVVETIDALLELDLNEN